MSCAIVSIIYGVPKTENVARKINEWELDENEERYFDGSNGRCGFQELYSAGGSYPVGYCGVELDQLKSYSPDLVSDYKFIPTEEQRKEAEEKVARLDPELRVMTGPIGVYFIWHDS